MAEETTNKLVGMLIQVLHGDYSDTRELAVIQLVALGEKAIPPLMAFLKREDEIEFALKNCRSHTAPWSYYPGKEEDFTQKFGFHPDDLLVEPVSMQRTKSQIRRCAIDGALKALNLLGIQNEPQLFPNLIPKK